MLQNKSYYRKFNITLEYVSKYNGNFMACLDGGGKEGEWRGVE